MTISPIRRAAGWSLALVAALLLNLVLTRNTTLPQGAVLSAQQPHATAQPSVPWRAPSRSAGDPIDRLPPVVALPPGGDTGSGSARPQELIPLNARQAAALQAATHRARAAFGLDALAIGVSLHGTEGWSGASGWARDGLNRLDGSSPFAIASITKTFTATLTLQLVDERRLHLNDRVTDLLPGVQIPDTVRVAHLLRHTSGLADLLEPMRDELNADIERLWQPSEVIGEVPGPWFAPGLSWAYSNTNYVLLGMIIERVSGQPFATLLHQRLLDPLGMTGTGVLLSKGAPYLMAPSWASAFGTSGDMYTNAHDLLRWGDALYGGRVLSAKALAHMLDFRRHRYGMGAERIKVGDATGYGHSGLLRGFTSLMVHLPHRDMTLVLMGTTLMFDPATVLAYRAPGKPSILDLAERAAAADAAA
ncbi:MAG TPA: serine hydrolase domain-containing protein [Candidatus Limnocylindria bacterium]|jgi:D-alanyl-D-alanine carboxypeptidase